MTPLDLLIHFVFSLSTLTMSPSKLGVFANLALAASAVLIPPQIAAEDFGGDDNSLETLAINPFKRSVALECPGCAFATQDGDTLTWNADVGNAFVSAPKAYAASLRPMRSITSALQRKQAPCFTDSQ